MAPAPHHIIAQKYKLQRELARGGMGSVWVARDLLLDREVAIKLVLAEGPARDAMRERFVREAKSLAGVSSRHIVHVFDFGVDEGAPYLVMELLQGEELGTRLKRLSRLTIEEVQSLGAQVAKALTAAHEVGIVHRDLKPGNIFFVRVDGEEVVKLLDFGIAKAPQSAIGAADLTGTGAFVGTPRYMSPEQFRSAPQVDLRSDLWSLAVVLYQCLTGTQAFAGDSLGELVMAIAAEPLPVASRAQAGLPPGVDDFFRRAFQREPRDRFSSARELAEALGQALGSPASTGPGSLPASAVPLAEPPVKEASPKESTADAETFQVDALRSIPGSGSSAVPPSASPTRGQAPSASIPEIETGALASRPRTGSGVLALPERPSIAVMPFANLSGDPEQDYFADGMVEDLITALSRLRSLFVIARSSTQVYKGRQVDLRTVASELGVRYVLEGTVRRAGERVRITGQLVEAATGTHLWSERYDGTLADVFDLQDRITESVMGAIEPSVRKAEIERARRKPPESLDAYDLVFRALPHVVMQSPATATVALSLLEQALTLDPDYALAHGYAAWCFEQRFVRGGHDPTDRSRALFHARTALAHGGDDTTALAVAGFVLAILDREAPEGLAALDAALDLNPNLALAYGLSAVVRVFRGDFAHGIEHAERAIRLSPMDPMRLSPLIAIASAHSFSHHHAEAATVAEKAAQINPRFPVALIILAAARIRLGQVSQAHAAVARLLALDPTHQASSYAQSVVLFTGRPDWGAEITAALREAGVPG